VNILALIILILFGSSCNKQEEAVDDCSSLNTCETVVQNSPTVKKLLIEYADTDFYDINTKKWLKIGKEYFDLGTLGTIPAYSHTLNISIDDAIDLVKLSSVQVSTPESFVVDDYSSIPFIKMKVVKGARYAFNYTRYDGDTIFKDTTNSLVISPDGTSYMFSKQSKSYTITDDYVYLPLVNEVFNGYLADLDIGTQNQSNYTHKISIVAQSGSAISSDISKMTFNLDLRVPIKSFLTKVDTELENFTLPTRWAFYYKDGIDTDPNDDLDFAYIEDGQEVPDALPQDIRYKFKTAPVIKIKQKIFAEETIDLLTYKTTGVTIPYRGNVFREYTTILDSSNHFKMKYKANGEDKALDGDNEIIKRNIPSGVRWKLSFVADLNKSLSFPSGQDFLTPLKPECNQAKGSAFLPNTEIASRDANISSGGFTSVCHTDTAQKETIIPADYATSPIAKEDTWFDFFSFEKTTTNLTGLGQLVEDRGYFLGVRSVEFSISGCIRIYSREASASETNPNAWDLKTEAHADCDDGSQEGWVYFTYTFGDDIFTNRSKYDGLLDLQGMIDSYAAAVPVNFPRFYFNGSSESNKIW
jgi:hypothetical protein